MQQYNPNARYRFSPLTLRSLLLNLHALLRQAVKRPPKETYEITTSKLNLGVTR